MAATHARHPSSSSSSAASMDDDADDDDDDWDFLDDVVHATSPRAGAREGRIERALTDEDAVLSCARRAGDTERMCEDIVVDEGDAEDAEDAEDVDVGDDDDDDEIVVRGGVTVAAHAAAHTDPMSWSSRWVRGADAILDALVRLAVEAREALRRAMSSGAVALHPFVVRFARAWARMHRRVRDLMKEPLSWPGVVFVGVGVATGVFVLRRRRGGSSSSASASTCLVDFDARMPTSSLATAATATTTLQRERSSSWMTYTVYPYDKPFYLI